MHFRKPGHFFYHDLGLPLPPYSQRELGHPRIRVNNALNCMTWTACMTSMIVFHIYLTILTKFRCGGDQITPQANKETRVLKTTTPMTK